LLPAALKPQNRHLSLFLSLKAADLVIAAGSALLEHHHAALNRFS